MAVVKDLKERGIAFETLDGISTKDGATGNLVLPIFGAVAEFEKGADPGTHPGRACGGQGRRQGERPQALNDAGAEAPLAVGESVPHVHFLGQLLYAWSEGEAWMRWRTLRVATMRPWRWESTMAAPSAGGLDRQGGSDLSIA